MAEGGSIIWYSPKETAGHLHRTVQSLRGMKDECAQCCLTGRRPDLEPYSCNQVYIPWPFHVSAFTPTGPASVIIFSWDNFWVFSVSFKQISRVKALQALQVLFLTAAYIPPYLLLIFPPSDWQSLGFVWEIQWDTHNWCLLFPVIRFPCNWAFISSQFCVHALVSYLPCLWRARQLPLPLLSHASVAPEDAFVHEASQHVTPKEHGLLANLGFRSHSHLTLLRHGRMKHRGKHWEGPQCLQTGSRGLPRQPAGRSDAAAPAFPRSPALLLERQVTAGKISDNKKSKNYKLADLNLLHPNLGLFFSGWTEVTASPLLFYSPYCLSHAQVIAWSQSFSRLLYPLPYNTDTYL